MLLVGPDHGSRVTDRARSLWCPAPQRIAVFRALQLGDMLCAVPALRALRAHVPQARITLIGLPWAASLAARFARYVDDFIAFPGAAGFPEREPDTPAMPAFLRTIRERRFDLAIQLHGSGELSNAVVEAFGARRLAGFHRAGTEAPTPYFFPWPDDIPEVRRYLRLMAYLGVALQDEQLEFPLSARDMEEYLGLAAAHGLRRGRYVCVHPGARLRSRRWPAERFAAVADALAAAGWRIVITGSAEESALAREVRRAMQGAALDLCGATSLGSLAALIACSRLLVCNDTGVSHVAAALGTPSVVVSSGADARRWAPLDARRHRVLFHDVPCRPCDHAECPVGHPCALGVAPERVTLECGALLRGEAAHAA